jgi:hypothetical protein
MTTEKKEEILLDAIIGNPVDYAAFKAVLENDHRFIAFVQVPDEALLKQVKLGVKARVSFSPFDMSKGQILVVKEEKS